MKEISKRISHFPLELVFWTASILAVLLLDPAHDRHLSLCPLSQLGFDWCPGCGLGRAMNRLAYGDFESSWALHPLAPLAYVVISARIWQLVKNLKTAHNYG